MQIDDRDVIQLPFIQVNKDAPKVLVQEEVIMQLTNPKNNSGDGAGHLPVRNSLFIKPLPCSLHIFVMYAQAKYVVSKTVENDYKKENTPHHCGSYSTLTPAGPWTATFLASSRPVQFYKFNQ